MTKSDQTAPDKIGVVEEIYMKTVQLASEKLHVKFRESATTKQIVEYVKRQMPSGSLAPTFFASIMATAESCFYGEKGDMDAKIKDMQEKLEALRELWQNSPPVRQTPIAKSAATQVPADLAPVPPKQAQNRIEVKPAARLPPVDTTFSSRAKMVARNAWQTSRRNLSNYRWDVLLAFSVLDFSVILVGYSFLFYAWFHYYGTVTSFFPWSLYRVYGNYTSAAAEFYLGVVVSDSLLAISACAIMFYLTPSLRRSGKIWRPSPKAQR
jgi:hypothetical protein